MNLSDAQKTLIAKLGKEGLRRTELSAEECKEAHQLGKCGAVILRWKGLAEDRYAATAKGLAAISPERSTNDVPDLNTFQARNAAWLAEAMADDPTDLPERVARFGEEALELQQALGQSREDAHALVDYVFDRPIGEPAQEMGGTMTTLALLAIVAGLDMAADGERELARCSTAAVLAKIRGKRAGRAGRGPLPGPTLAEAPIARTEIAGGRHPAEPAEPGPILRRVTYIPAPEVRRTHSG